MMNQNKYKAAFRCFNGCAEAYPLNEIIYTCPQCNGLLEVWHDYNALKKRSGKDWRALFDSRHKLRARPSWTMSGVWSKREWVLPNIADENITSLGEGNTPLLRADRYAEQIELENLWVKLCGNS
ncbi:MAG: threonine synthase, partial [bacterium]